MISSFIIFASMFRFLAILLGAYLLYKLVKLIIIGIFAPKRKPADFSQSTKNPPKMNKIINKDEGEYVDFEEVDRKK